MVCTSLCIWESVGEKILVALPDTFAASRLVFFDRHLPKFDVNIDRVISCDFVPSLSGSCWLQGSCCWSSWAPKPRNLCCTCRILGKGHSKGKLQTDENSENFKFSEIQVNSEIQVSIGQSSPLFDDVLTGFFRFSTCPSPQCPGGRDVWALEK